MRCEGGAEAHMADLGFGPLLLVDSFPVTMSGATRSNEFCNIAILF